MTATAIAVLLFIAPPQYLDAKIFFGLLVSELALPGRIFLAKVTLVAFAPPKLPREITRTDDKNV
jgi:hypothetical protein